LGRLVVFSAVADKVRRLSVTARGRCDVGAIASLTNLRYLRLNEGHEAVAPKLVFDFSSLVHLEECFISWQKNYAANLFDCPKLASLTIWKYGPALGDIVRGTGLRSLHFSESALVDLAGIEHLSKLETLRLGNLRKFEDLRRSRNSLHSRRLPSKNAPSWPICRRFTPCGNCSAWR
jgi:hypothetical protein